MSTTTAITTANPAVRMCLCGCGLQVAKRMYRPGHDARHAGDVARSVAATRQNSLLEGLPTPALRAKASDMVARLDAKAAKAAKATKTAKVSGRCKVGRWVYEAEMVEGADSLRYRNAQGVWVGSTKPKVVASFVTV